MVQQEELPSRKRIFISLLLLTFLLLLVIINALGWIGTVGLQQLDSSLPLLFQLLVGLFFIFLTGIVASLILTVMRGQEFFFGRKLRGLTIKVFLPMMIIIGRLLGIPKDTVKKSFIEINNQLILSRQLKVPAERILILLPHCLQLSDCQRKITTKIENCLGCGKCTIKNLVELAQKYGAQIAVATGGTLARKIVKDYRPQLIIAVACERDLTSGIHDTYPLPVFGILNRRPNGPCWNTNVEVQRVEEAIRHFIKV